MTVASKTRSAVREHPFIYDGLRAGVINYTAAARFLDVGETDAVGAALRRYAEELDEYEPPAGSASVSMQSGVGVKEDGEGLLTVGETTFGIDDGTYTAIVANGSFDPVVLGTILERFRAADLEVVAAGSVDGSATIIVNRRAGPDAVRVVEAVLQGSQATH